MALHRPSPKRQAAALLLAIAVALLGLSWQSPQPVLGSGFVGPLGAQPKGGAGAQPRLASRLRLSAEAKGKDEFDDGPEIVDADVLVGEDGEEEFEEEENDEGAVLAPDSAFPPEAYKEYVGSTNPPESWFERRMIDRHKVNNVFFDMFAKSKNFFPHQLQPGDTVRVFYMDPSASEDSKDKNRIEIKSVQETYFDGVILNFRGQYHARTMTLRAMVGKNENIMGMEMNFPMHSPLVRRIQVLRRGYIGRNKNAYFIRGMVGKRNVIPLDKERAEVDQMYLSLREAGREDEIPESEYPQQEWDRYPLPVWKQDLDAWDEEKYAPHLVDQRNQYERTVIARYKKKVKGPGGKPAGGKGR